LSAGVGGGFAFRAVGFFGVSAEATRPRGGLVVGLLVYRPGDFAGAFEMSNTRCAARRGQLELLVRTPVADVVPLTALMRSS